MNEGLNWSIRYNWVSQHQLLGPSLFHVLEVHVRDKVIFFNLVGWDLTPLGPFAGPLGSYKSQYCGHTLAYCTLSPDDT
jgi:hypothetical protein